MSQGSIGCGWGEGTTKATSEGLYLLYKRPDCSHGVPDYWEAQGVRGGRWGNPDQRRLRLWGPGGVKTVGGDKNENNPTLGGWMLKEPGKLILPLK